MATQSWTELFFLDEATALAAGHRPCFFCRRDDAKAFQAAWAQAQRCDKPRASEMDEVLHSERIAGRARRLHNLPASLRELPDGVMVQTGAESFLIVSGRPLLWSPAGYQPAVVALADAKLLTPPSTVGALLAGYRPVLHPSAGVAA
jgi:hypothetical protein